MFETIDTSTLITIIPIAAVVILLLILIGMGYVKASPDTALIISGLRKNPKVLIGKAGIKIPFLERKDELNLQLIPIDVKTSNAVPTADYININVDAAVNVKISDNEERLKLAAQNFLNKNPEYIGRVAREVLEGNMREIVGKMALEEMVQDRQKFAFLVKENAEPDLAAMGLDIISFNVQNFVDGNGVIENLGVDNIVKIQKNAAISRAESEKEIAKAQASAKQEANEAEVASNMDIATKQNELAIRQAELKKEADIKQAEADAAYKIQEQEQRKKIDAASVEADTVKQEKLVILKQREVEAQEQVLKAEVEKKADADKYAREKAAEADKYARMAEADARQYEAQKEAEALERKAQAVKMQGEAEAAAIQAKGVAEAAAIEKKAEAMQKYGEAAKMEMIVGVLPQMAAEISKSVAAIDKLTVIDSGSGSAVNSVGDMTPQILKRTIEVVKETTGFDLTEVMAAQTKAAMTDRHVSVDGIPSDIKVEETFNAKNDAAPDGKGKGKGGHAEEPVSE